MINGVPCIDTYIFDVRQRCVCVGIIEPIAWSLKVSEEFYKNSSKNIVQQYHNIRPSLMVKIWSESRFIVNASQILAKAEMRLVNSTPNISNVPLFCLRELQIQFSFNQNIQIWRTRKAEMDNSVEVGANWHLIYIHKSSVLRKVFHCRHLIKTKHNVTNPPGNWL